MKIGPDLNSADRETLLAVIAEQQTTIAEQQLVIAELRRRVNELERRVTRGPSGGMPGNKPGEESPRVESPESSVLTASPDSGWSPPVE